MLKADHLVKTYHRSSAKVHALDDVSVAIRAGEFVAVQGPSGCGKTTLLLAAGGLLAPDRGEVLIDGSDLYATSASARARLRAKTIGFVFQQFHLVPYLTVLENILVPSLGTPAVAEPRARAMELVERFNLGHRTDHIPAELSTGERQRAALARAMLNSPKLLLADEPTGNLDTENAKVVLTALNAFAGEGGAVLLVTHDQQAAEASHRVIRMKEGKVLENGQTAVTT